MLSPLRPATESPLRSPFQARVGRSGFDVYVDSVNGSNANDGLTALTPKQTLAGIGTITAGLRIGLARGSYFREALDGGSVTGVMVGAYGSGARPVIDGSDAVSAGSWTKTSGRTNVYEITRTAFVAPASEHASLWLTAGLAGVRAASLTACDSTPGSFFTNYTSGSAGTAYQIYVHPAGSTNPQSNGVAYFAGARLYCINLTNATVSDVVTKRQLHHDGSLRVIGAASTLRRVLAQEGYIHDIYTAGGILQDCDTADTELGYSVVNQPQAAGGTLLSTGGSSTQTVPCTGPAFFLHGVNSVDLSISSRQAVGSETFFSTADARGKIVIVDGRHQAGSAGLSKRSFEILQQYDPGACDLFLIRPKTISSTFLYMQAISAGMRVFIWEPMAVCTSIAAQLLQCTEVHCIGGMLYTSSSGSNWNSNDTTSRANVTLKHNMIQMAPGGYYVFANGAGTYDLNRNVYWQQGAGADQRWQYNGTNFIGPTPWLNWQAAGRDVNSVYNVDPLLTTPPTGISTLAGLDSMLNGSGQLAVSSGSSPLVTVGAGPGRVPLDYVFPPWVPADVRALCGRS